jgi:hypothetical protein
MGLELLDVSKRISVNIQCTEIAYRYVTGLWAPSLRSEEHPLPPSCPFFRTLFRRGSFLSFFVKFRIRNFYKPYLRKHIFE